MLREIDDTIPNGWTCQNSLETTFRHRAFTAAWLMLSSPHRAVTNHGKHLEERHSALLHGLQKRLEVGEGAARPPEALPVAGSRSSRQLPVSQWSQGDSSRRVGLFGCDSYKCLESHKPWILRPYQPSAAAISRYISQVMCQHPGRKAEGRGPRRKEHAGSRSNQDGHGGGH